MEDKYKALAFGLDHHMSTRTNKSIIENESELFLQSITGYVSYIPDNKNSNWKKS